MKRLPHTPLGLLLRRIALLYAVLMLCRIVFWIYNCRLLGTPAWSELGLLLAGALKFDTVSVGYADGLFILLSLLPLPWSIRQRSWYRNLLYGYYVAVNALLIVVTNLADCVYFHYAQKRFTADELLFADNDNSLLLAGRFLIENWFLIPVAAGLILLLARGYGRRIREERLYAGALHYVAATLSLLLAAGLCIIGIRGGATRMTRPITLSNAMLYTADGNRANLILSNPFCILRTVGDARPSSYRRYYDAEQAVRRFDPVHAPADSAAVNLAGRNVMIFIMESMSAEHSAHLRPDLYASLPEREGFTPFLDSLMRSGLTFRRMYANGTRSIQAMPSVLGSIPSFHTPFVLMPQSLGPSRQLPAMLADKGYETLFFCGSERGSMGFGAYARSAGIKRLVSREEYEAAHGTKDFDGYWGIWDEPFLQYAGEVLSRTPEPFFGTLFTLSAHHPFVVPAAYADSLPAGYTKIHRGAAYDDMAFRRFFERFGNEEWFRRTIFVFVADHVSSEKFADDTRSYPGNMHIIGFIYTPDGAVQGEIDQIAQQIDIMPTLLGLLGNDQPYFAFGRDLLNEPQRPRWSVSYDGDFRALTERAVLRFDDHSERIEPRPGTNFDTESESTTDAELLADFKALVQQYYTRIEQQNYTTNHD